MQFHWSGMVHVLMLMSNQTKIKTNNQLSQTSKANLKWLSVQTDCIQKLVRADVLQLHPNHRTMNVQEAYILPLVHLVVLHTLLKIQQILQFLNLKTSLTHVNKNKSVPENQDNSLEHLTPKILLLGNSKTFGSSVYKVK